MPQGKQKGKGKQNGKRKGKGKKAQKGGEGETNKLLRTYEKTCAQTNSRMCPGIRKLLKMAAEEDRLITKFIFESAPVEKEGQLPVLLEPFIMSLREVRYRHIQNIHIWDYPMTYENTATLALFLEKSFYPIRMLELLDCLMDAEAVSRLVRPLNNCDFLSTLILDYNEFGDEGSQKLCAGLHGNKTLLSLSLCYCDLNIESGKHLGHIVSTTAVRELYLDGNELQCEGTMELIKLCVDQAEIEAYLREEEAKRKAEEELLKAEQEKQQNYDGANKRDGSASEKDLKGDKAMSAIGIKNKKGERKKKKKKTPKAPPPIGPWIHKLHLADNGIDAFGGGGSFAPIICMRLFKKLIMTSKCLEELDLTDNSIGELGGRELKEGLQYRKEAKLGSCKVHTTHKLTTDTFSSVVKLGSRLTRKGKKKGKKRKKK
ncbi:hypothetical protein BsWGS_09117 [Bradybaena similaris]